MICLTLTPEPAEAIACGDKIVENRSWGLNTDGSFRKGLDGLLGIHRGGKDGAIIATAIVDTILTPKEALKRFPKQKRHIFGPQCWILTNVRRIKPIPCKGNQGLWKINLSKKDLKYID